MLNTVLLHTVNVIGFFYYSYMYYFLEVYKINAINAPSLA